MRIHSLPRLCSIALLFSSLFFSGCFEIYYDIVQNSDGTFVIRQTVGLSDQFFEGLSEFSAIGDSTTTPIPRQAIIDSMRHTFALRRDSLVEMGHIIGMNGISSLAVHDTAIDTMTYFTIETGVTSLDQLPGAFHLTSNMSKLMHPGAEQEDSDDIRLIVSRSKEKTTLTFKARQKEEGFVNIGIPGAEESLKNLHMRYRVFSASLERPADKLVKQIPGGQERVFGLSELLKKGRHAHLDATFVIKNTAQP